MTGAELEQRNIDVMGETLGKQYSVLFREVAALHLYWNEFLALFATSDERIKRLNQAAPAFFQMVQDQQFETNMSHLTRLTDNAATGKKQNLTIRNLPDLVSDQPLKDKLLVHIDDVVSKTEFCRDWRNRRFAHNDLLLATKDGRATPLPSATKEKIADALRALSDLMNVMERFYHKGGCSFEDVISHNGAGALLSILGFGVKARDEMMEKVKAGDFTMSESPEHV
jgi:AbiU2